MKFLIEVEVTKHWNAYGICTLINRNLSRLEGFVSAKPVEEQPATDMKCDHCGNKFPKDELFKRLCESCLSIVHPGKEICYRCDSEWATYIPPAGIQAGPTCDECASDGAYLTHCLSD